MRWLVAAILLTVLFTGCAPGGDALSGADGIYDTYSAGDPMNDRTPGEKP